MWCHWQMPSILKKLGMVTHITAHATNLCIDSLRDHQGTILRNEARTCDSIIHFVRCYLFPKQSHKKRRILPISLLVHFRTVVIFFFKSQTMNIEETINKLELKGLLPCQNVHVVKTHIRLISPTRRDYL